LNYLPYSQEYNYHPVALSVDVLLSLPGQNSEGPVLSVSAVWDTVNLEAEAEKLNTQVSSLQ
jgi:hypothetical protein